MSETLSNLLSETRQFAPPAELAAGANVTADAYAEAEADRLAFWAEQANRLSWETPFTDVLDWSDAPVWTPESIDEATRTWFAYLGDGEQAEAK